MKKATVLSLSLFLMVGLAQAQQTEFDFLVSNSTDQMIGYVTGLQSGARDIDGPFDLDGDGLYEILVSDYTAGGRVHVIENKGVDTCELVYSTPWLDSTATTNNIRAIAGGDMDGDGFGEIAFLAGRSYSATNPNIADLPAGLYVFENVGDDDFGTAPTSIYEFDGDLPDRWRTEQMIIKDIDGDGLQELMMGNNGSDNRYDAWYVLSVTDLGSGGFEVWQKELHLTSRAIEDVDNVGRGGGSAYAIHPADLDGNGMYDLSMHSWNNFNFTNASVTGADTYVAPDANATNINLAASTGDEVSFFGGVVVDIDANGDDEIFYPNLQTGNVAILNYESGEDVLQVTTDNVVLDVIPGLSSLGIGLTDLDGDGAIEIIGTGSGYTNTHFADGNPATWFNYSEFNGGDPEDPTNYSTVTAVEASLDTYNSFHTINRMDGTTEYIDEGVDVSVRDDVVIGSDNHGFASKFISLGDADNDGRNEVAFGIQGLADSLYTLTEVAADSFIIASVESNENRVFMKVIAGNGLVVSIEDERIIIPSDYKLHDNYPNPFNPTTTISFTLPIDKAISVRVYDMTGQLVRTLVNSQFYTEGSHEVVWDATNDFGQQVASGSYLYSLEYGNFRKSKTMILLT